MTAVPNLQDLYVQVCEDRRQLIDWLAGILEGCDGCRVEAEAFIARLKTADVEEDAGG